MTEDDARGWVRDRFGVSRETLLHHFLEAVIEESTRQNLIAGATIPRIWQRHVVDSAQLVPLSKGAGDGLWIDIGTGAGFPGLVAAILTDRPVLLIEPRRKRAEFLERSVLLLGLALRVRVAQGKAENIQASATVISARAVAALPALFSVAHHLSTPNTLWLLPKRRSAQAEVAAAKAAWQGTFHVEQSLTDPDSFIVVAERVVPL